MNHSTNNFNNPQNPLMTQESINFHEELLQKIKELQSETPNSIHLIKRTFELVKQEVSKMNHWQSTYIFTDETEEIYFYKTVRPTILAQFLYYQELYDWESSAPLTDADLANYYNEKHQHITSKIIKLSYVKSYIKTEEKKFFLLDTITTHYNCMSELSNKNWRPCLQHCIPIAEYMCYELQLSYLKEKYSMYKTTINTNNEKIPWNGNLIDFAEIIFALYHKGMFGDMSLKEVTVRFELIIDVKISQNLPKRWRDIAKRKQDSAKFLLELAQIITNQTLNS